MGSTLAKVSTMSSSSSSSDDIELKVVDLGDVLKTKSHEEILLTLREKELELGDLCKNGKDHPNAVTVYKAILSHVTNGDKLISTILDQSVHRAGDGNPNSADSYLNINLARLISSRKPNVQVIKDMIDLKTPATRALLTHPVIETYLSIKWRKWKKLFLVQFLIYLLFLIVYSAFLANIFYRKGRRTTFDFTDLIVENNRVIFPSEFMTLLTTSTTTASPERPDDLPSIAKAETYRWCGKDLSLRCGLEITLSILIGLLAVQEILQFFSLGPKRYLSEFENWLEIATLTLSTLGLIYQKDLAVFKWFSAFGICLAYVVVIFLLGRYPMLGGSISLMFYTITKHLFRTLLSFLIMVLGFAFGFFIIHHNSGNDKFQNFGKALLKTLVMAVGEFDFDDLYAAHEDPYTLVFTMTLLTFLIILVTLVLINLLVALIVSDLDELRSSGHIQELVNKAQHIVQIETALKSLCCYVCKPKNSEILEVKVCAHSQCKCRFEKLDRETVSQLVKIVQRRQFVKDSQMKNGDNRMLMKLITQILTSDADNGGLLDNKKVKAIDDNDLFDLINE